MDENKKGVALVRCEFDEEGGVATHTEVCCNDMQLLVFVSNTLEIAANLLNESPECVAKTSIFIGKFNMLAEAESENGEES